MEWKRISFAETPEKITQEAYDCVWIFLAERTAPSPFKSRALEWLDWKLEAQISRSLWEWENSPVLTTVFFPTMKRMPTPFLAVEGSLVWDANSFLANCEGLKLEHVLCLCEAPGDSDRVEKKIRGLIIDQFPKQISIGTDLATRGSSP